MNYRVLNGNILLHAYVLTCRHGHTGARCVRIFFITFFGRT